MSADRLREAARVLRERAEAATPGPWDQTGVMGSEYDDIVDSPEAKHIVADCDTKDEDASYIATMHPGVGLALADWLTREAYIAGVTCRDVAREAADVADAILGGAA